jgi:luciferase family oxidoreductase group 1
MALRGSREALEAEDFPQQLAELRAYGGAGLSVGRPVRPGLPDKITAIPTDVPLPPIWLLGSSDYSARLSAQLGLGFGFAAHFSDYPPELPMRLYRDQFKPGPFEHPHAILTLSVVCAPTDGEAERLLSSLLVAFARLRTGQASLLLPPDQAIAYEFSPAERSVVESIRGRHIAGSPARVKARIEEIAASTMADEVMVSTFIYGHEERKRSYELLAKAFDLPRSE